MARRTLAERVAAALDRAPQYVRDELLRVAEVNRRRERTGLPMVDGDGNVVRERRSMPVSLNTFIHQDYKH